MMRSNDIQLLIMDVMMPRMDGIRATLKSVKNQISDHYSFREERRIRIRFSD